MSKLTKVGIQPEENANTEPRVRGQKREEAIRTGVLKAVSGRPSELLRVSVLPLWGDKFRVNVWVTGDTGAAIPNSYFVTADASGAVLSAEPPIQKLY